MKRLRLLSALLLAVCVAWGIFGSQMGRMSPDEPLAPADMLVVLGGGIAGEREEKACEIYRAGLVREAIILTGANHERFVPDRQAIIQGCGVPEQMLQHWPDVKNTFEEMTRIAQNVRSKNLSKVIVVSDPPHMPRLHYLRGLLRLEEKVILSRSRLALTSSPIHFYRLLVFWYREPLAYLYYRTVH